MSHTTSHGEVNRQLENTPQSQQNPASVSVNDAKSPAFQVVFNYWENRSALTAQNEWVDPKTQILARLDHLVRQGHTQIAVMVPWQLVEADITHAFSRFLQAAVERRLRVQLIVTPELGVGLPNTGLPRDVISRSDCSAKAANHAPFCSVFAPGVTALPSLFAPEYTKRYFAFLARLDGVLSQLERAGAKGPLIRVALGGSFWKSYCDPSADPSHPFLGVGGDRSSHAEAAFRKHLEQFFLQREFASSIDGGVHRWREPKMDSANRRWFYQLSEDVFRVRSLSQLRRKSKDRSASNLLDFKDAEIFTPEAEPVFRYANALAEIAPTTDHFELLSKYLDEAAKRFPIARGQVIQRTVRWTSIGPFRNLSDSQKQFLIFKSLLLFGSFGGSVLVDESEYQNFSPAFKHRLGLFAKAIEEGTLKSEPRILMQVAHLWSSEGSSTGSSATNENDGNLKQALERETDGEFAMVAHPDAVSISELGKNANVLFVDAQCLVTADSVRKWLFWLTRSKNKSALLKPRVLAIVKSKNCSDAAIELLQDELRQSKPLHFSLGLDYQVGQVGNLTSAQSWLVVVDGDSLDKFLKPEDKQAAWHQFVRSMLSLAEARTFAKQVGISEGRLQKFALSLKTEHQGGVALVLLNPHSRSLKTNLSLSHMGLVSDLGQVLAQRVLQKNKPQDSSRDESFQQQPINQFEIEVPGSGLLAIALQGGNWWEQVLEEDESIQAQHLAGDLKESVQRVGEAELPGGSFWN